MTRKLIIYVSASLLVLLFIVTGLEKIVKFQDFSEKMSSQVFGKELLPLLTVVIPTAEVTCSVLLVIHKSRLFGFISATLLLTIFTVYIILVLLHVFSRYPCPCGGPLEKLTWAEHLMFNLSFLLISTIGLVLTIQERRSGKLS